MHKLGTIFSELLKLYPRYQFEKAVERYQGDRYMKTFSTWQQFITILYSQIKQKDSLRDIEAGLTTQFANGITSGFNPLKGAPYLMPIPKGTIGYLRSSSIIP